MKQGTAKVSSRENYNARDGRSTGVEQCNAEVSSNKTYVRDDKSVGVEQFHAEVSWIDIHNMRESKPTGVEHTHVEVSNSSVQSGGLNQMVPQSSELQPPWSWFDSSWSPCSQCSNTCD